MVWVGNPSHPKKDFKTREPGAKEEFETQLRGKPKTRGDDKAMLLLVSRSVFMCFFWLAVVSASGANCGCLLVACFISA